MSKQTKRAVKGDPASTSVAIAGGIVSAGMAFAIAAILCFAWIAEEVFEGESLVFDIAVREWIHAHAAYGLTVSMQFFSFLASTLSLTTVTVLLIAVLLVKRQGRTAIILAVVMAGGVVLNFVLKGSFHRVRPEPYFETPLPASFSFPSGHSLFSACFFGIVAWLIASKSRSLPTKAAVWATAAVIVLLVGLSRVYLGVHFPTDVIAGYLAATVWLLAVISADSYLEKRG